jgi:hypothetical protein
VGLIAELALFGLVEARLLLLLDHDRRGQEKGFVVIVARRQRVVVFGPVASSATSKGGDALGRGT